MPILLAVAISLSPLTVNAQGTAVEIGSAEGVVGQSIKLPVVVKSVTDPRGLGAYHFKIDFDPQGIRVDEVLGGDRPFDAVAANVSEGHAEIASFHAQIPGPTGNIRVARLAITVLRAGNWTLGITIYPQEFVNTDGIPIAANGINGIITPPGTEPVPPPSEKAPGAGVVPPPSEKAPGAEPVRPPSEKASGAGLVQSPSEEETATAISWWLIGIIIAAVIVSGGLVGYLARRR